MGKEELIRWGILGAGIIAEKMAEALIEDGDSRIEAVASKSSERVGSFASRFSIPKALTYDQLAADPDVDIVYIATTHNFHYENARQILESGKPVIMEKPFTVNAEEARKLIELAREKNLFLLEAYWVRFLPSLIRMKEIIASGIIGDVRQVSIFFADYVPEKYKSRLVNPALAGGVTLDKGIYPVSFLCYMLDAIPSEIQSMCRFSESGVDEIVNYQFRFPSGTMAQVVSSYALKIENKAGFYGTKGFIEFPDFPSGNSFTVNIHNGSNEVTSSQQVIEPNPENGFICEARECVRCLREGKKESDIMPLDETLAIMKVLDRIRQQWNFRYDFE